MVNAEVSDCPISTDEVTKQHAGSSSLKTYVYRQATSLVFVVSFERSQYDEQDVQGGENFLLYLGYCIYVFFRHSFPWVVINVSATF